ncbi:molecular chaperone [Escherichia coli]|nr:molecular chaperone [Escherichia coli]
MGVCAVALMAGSVFTSQVHAGGLGLSTTRIIFNQSDKGAEVTFRNNGSALYLVQPAVVPAGEDILKETGLKKPSPVESQARAPFIVTPPLFRSEPGTENVLRILRTGGQFPADRESLFYFRFNAIPPSPEVTDGKEASTGKVGTQLSIALGMSVKLFYRPKGLSESPDGAYSRLTFRRVKAGVELSNPTPYFQTLSSLTLGGVAVDLNKQPSMVAPFSKVVFTGVGPGSQAVWTTINDYGGDSAQGKASIL